MLKEIYLFERIDANAANREAIRYLKCIAFLRPTPQNIELLQKELRAPKYAQYYICKMYTIQLFYKLNQPISNLIQIFRMSLVKVM